MFSDSCPDLKQCYHDVYGKALQTRAVMTHEPSRTIATGLSLTMTVYDQADLRGRASSPVRTQMIVLFLVGGGRGAMSC